MLARLAAAAALAILVLSPSARAGGPAPLPPPEGRNPALERYAATAAALERDRRDPRGIALVSELDLLEEQLPELASIAALYARVAEAVDTDPEVRAAARFRLAQVERARGNLQRAATNLRRLGFVTRFRIVGPFDDEGKRAFSEALPPEKALDLSARYRGKVREIAWRELPADAAGDGFVHLGAALRPAREVAAYALAVVEAPRDERVTLWFGGSGAAKVFVNGALAISDPGYHPARPDQRGAAVTLRKGANRILVKLCHQDGRMGFFLRLADDRGEGRAVPAADPSAPAVAAGPAPKALEDAVTRLERRADALRGKGRAEAEARLDLARALAGRHAADRDERRAAAEARRAAALAPGLVDAQLEAARLEEDHGKRRLLVEAALRAVPEDPRALRALAREEQDQERPHAAVRLLARAVAAAPGWPEARVAYAEALERAGLEPRAALLAAENAAAFPTVPGAVRVAARAARRLGRVDEAAARYRTLLALRVDDGEARSALASLLADRGDVAGARDLLLEALRLDPSDVFQRLRLADLLAANGRPQEAEAAYAQAIALSPDEADAHERRGRARLALGRAKDAQEDVQRALELRPQSSELKELARSLEPARERFERPYLADARAVAQAAPPPGAEDDAVVLSDLKVTRVLPSGMASSAYQLVVKVVNTRGADAFRRHTISWAPDRQEVKVDRARILKPDGTVVDSHDESEGSASEPWYRLYYDTLAKTLSFPALAPGDVLELAWRVDDTAGENLLSDYFGDLTFVDETTRKLAFDYVLLVPEAREIHANRQDGVAHARRALPGGVVEHRFTSRDVPRIAPEPRMPGWSEVARYVHVSTYASWDQVNRFYWGLVRDAIRPTADVRAEAERLARAALDARAVPAPRFAKAQGPAADAAPIAPPPGGWDPETKRLLVRAVYGFVVSQTRYVGLEFGIHGFKPYRVDQILARRFGDCKDKASLMHALLEALGIDSRLVLLRMRRLGRLPEAPASLAVFNHAILYVPELDLWLDGTAAYSGSGDLPAEDRGATVLVVNPSGPPRFARIPEATPDENRIESRHEIALRPDGAADVKGGWRVAGVEAPTYRRSYLAEGERSSQLEATFSRAFPGVRVEAVQVSDPTRIEEALAVQFALEVPRYAQPDGDGLRFTPFGAARGYAEAWGALSARKHPLDLGSPSRNVFEYRVSLPAGWRVAEVPEPVSLETPFGAFQIRYRQDGGALVGEGQVTLAGGVVAPADYPAFRGLVSAIDRAFARRVRIAPPAEPRATAPPPAAATPASAARIQESSR
jgi:cellulose synthase operon protein C